jgi:hypothetical protein
MLLTPEAVGRLYAHAALEAQARALAWVRRTIGPSARTALWLVLSTRGATR